MAAAEAPTGKITADNKRLLVAFLVAKLVELSTDVGRIRRYSPVR
jgi:hypothetical protein